MADTGHFSRVESQDADRHASFDGHAGEPDALRPRTGSADLIPLWFQRGLVIVTAAVVCIGGVGLLLAVLGVYHLAVALVVGGLAMVLVTAVAWPRAAPASAAPSTRGSVFAAIGMCVVAAASVAWNGHYAGHHVSIGRDPGVYSVTAKWLATHGNLEVHQGLEWTSKSPDVTVVYAGSYGEGANTTEFQFDHLTPVLLAIANNIGGDRLMFKVPAVLGALALCAIFAAGCRVVRKPWLVLAAVIGLAVSLPQLNVTRDTFSEPAVQLLLWAGIWLLLHAYERGRPGVALLAGAALAGTMMSRIDAPVYLIPLPLLAALTWLSARSLTKRRMLGPTLRPLPGRGRPRRRTRDTRCPGSGRPVLRRSAR